MNSITGNPRLDALLGPLLVQSGAADSPQAQAARNATAYQQQTAQALQGMVGNTQLNGQPVNPSGPAATANDYANSGDALTANLWGNIGNNATSLLNNLLNNATTQQGQANTNAYNMGNLNLNRANSGWTDINGNNMGDSSTGGTGNPRIDNYVSAVMNGTRSISDVPSDIQPRVLGELQKRGYDPAKELWGDLAHVQSLYGKGGGVGTGGNSLAKAGMGIEDLLNAVGIKMGGEANKENYLGAANNFSSKYAKILGNVDLPDTGSNSQQAQDKFAALAQAIRNKFYQGGVGPSGGSSPLDAFVK